MGANPIPRDSDFVPDWARNEAAERGHLRDRLLRLGFLTTAKARRAEVLIRRERGQSISQIAGRFKVSQSRIASLLSQARREFTIVFREQA